MENIIIAEEIVFQTTRLIQDSPEIRNLSILLMWTAMSHGAHWKQKSETGKIFYILQSNNSHCVDRQSHANQPNLDLSAQQTV